MNDGIGARRSTVLLAFALFFGCAPDPGENGAAPLGESPGDEAAVEEAREEDPRALEALPESDRYEVELVTADGEILGTAAIEEEGDGVVVIVDFAGLDEGAYGFHFHETGLCEPPDFESAGGHLSSEESEHGFENPDGPHDGDLPNIVVESNGASRMEIFNARISLANLREGDGTTLLLHAGPDDYATDPDGDSGARIACGVISPR